MRTCLRWLETVAMPAMPGGVTHQHLLRAMDALMDHAETVEGALARQIRPLVDHDLAIVFYDLTTVRRSWRIVKWHRFCRTSISRSTGH